MTNPLRGLALLVLALALVAAGCGSKKKGPYQSSKADYAAALNSICTAVNAKMKAIGASSLADIATKGDQILAAGNDGIDKVKKLGTPPDEIKSAVDDFIAQQEKGSGIVKQVIAAAKAKDVAKATSLAKQLQALDPAIDADAKAIGAPACLSTAS